jgi:hypothetical protein
MSIGIEDFAIKDKLVAGQAGCQKRALRVEGRDSCCGQVVVEMAERSVARWSGRESGMACQEAAAMRFCSFRAHLSTLRPRTVDDIWPS